MELPGGEGVCFLLFLVIKAAVVLIGQYGTKVFNNSETDVFRQKTVLKMFRPALQPAFTTASFVTAPFMQLLPTEGWAVGFFPSRPVKLLFFWVYL